MQHSTELPRMKFPFEVSYRELVDNLDLFIDAIFAALESDFLIMPKGEGFVEFPIFQDGYEHLKRATSGFADFAPERVIKAVVERPIALLVLRTMLGFTPPEWAHQTSMATGMDVTQGWIRTLDRRVRLEPTVPLRMSAPVRDRLAAVVRTACELLRGGPPETSPDKVHRLDKVDTKFGERSIRTVAEVGVSYPALLYERYLGRPFAAHRDSISELVGSHLEEPIETLLSGAGISYRKTRRAERVQGFDQAPDFICPDENNPKVVIEAKLAQDDGTARDKVTRVQHLASLSIEGRSPGNPRFEVIACIGGRGFRVRREDMRKLLLSTRGKVFTLQTLDRLVDYTGLSALRSRATGGANSDRRVL